MRLKTKILVLLLTALLVAGTVMASQNDKAITYVTVKARSGSCLWQMCEQAKTQFNDERDIREIVYCTEKLNGLSSGGLIQPNQNIHISVERGRAH